MRNNMGKRKSQISTEFLFSIGFIILIFFGLVTIMYAKKEDIRKLDEIQDLVNDCQKVSNLISGVYTAGEGASYTIKVGSDFTIDADNQIVNTKDSQEVYCSFPFNRVANNFGSSNFNVLKGDVSFRNIDGIVVIANV